MDNEVNIESIFFQREKVQLESSIFWCESIQDYQSESEYSPNNNMVSQCA